LPENIFIDLQKISIDGVYGSGTISYYGQIDFESKKPHGLGVAVDKNKQHYEGSFNMGKIEPVYRWNKENQGICK